MADIAHALVRRAVDVTQAHLNDETRSDEEVVKQTVLAGGVILGLTIIVYMAVVSAVGALVLVNSIVLIVTRFPTPMGTLLLPWP